VITNFEAVLVAGSQHNLPVVHRKCHAEHVLGVAVEAPCGSAGIQTPQVQSAVPGARERELAVGGDDDVLDEVRVAREAPAREAVVALLTRERPHDHWVFSELFTPILSSASALTHFLSNPNTLSVFPKIVLRIGD
jgi:hypothetical protein